MGKSRNHYLATYAFISANLNRGGTVADGLCEIFKPILAPMSGRIFQSDLFAKSVQETYDIPTLKVAADGIGEKLLELGLLEKDSEDNLRVRKIEVSVPPETVLEVEKILDDYIQYSKQLIEENPGENEFTDDVLIDALTNFLLSAGPEAEIELTEVNYFKGNTLSRDKKSEKPNRTEQELNALVSMFLDDLKENSPERLEFLSAVSSAALLSDVVLTLQEPVTKAEIKGIKIYLDTPIIFALLDLSTPEDYDHASEFASLLKSCELELRLPEHLLVEFRTGLNTQIEAAINGSGRGYGTLVHRITGDELTRIRARNILSAPEKYLADLGIQISKETDILNIRYEQYIEPVEETTKELVGVMGSWFGSAARRANDARSIALSLYARSSKGAESLPECGEVFVTRNEQITKNGRSALIHRGYLDRREFPPVITDKELAGILWFAGTAAIGNLQKKKLLANCAAIMNPNQAVITSMKEALYKKDPKLAEEMEATILDPNARLRLSEISRGNENNLPSDDILETYDQIKKALIEDHTEQTKRELNQLEENHTQIVEALNKAKTSDRQEFENTIMEVVQTSDDEVTEKNQRIQKEAQARVETEKQAKLQLETKQYDLDKERNARSIAEKSLTNIDKRLKSKAKTYRTGIKFTVILLFLCYFVLISNFLSALNVLPEQNIILKMIIYIIDFGLAAWLGSNTFISNHLDKAEEKYYERLKRRLNF